MPKSSQEENVTNWNRLGRKLSWGAAGLLIGYGGFEALNAGSDLGWWGLGIGALCLIVSHSIKANFKVR